jgi:hypothetical protein
MKLYPPEPDANYKGNLGCYVVLVAAFFSIGALTILAVIFHIIFNLIN